MGGDLLTDGQGVLLSAVLLGEDHQVGVLSRYFPQVPPPVQGLQAGTAEHRHDAPAGVLRPGGAEQRLEAHAVVGVVHDGGDRPAGAGKDLHPAGDSGPFQSRVDKPGRNVQPLAHGDGGQGVLHVEQPRHGEPELPLIPPGAHLEQDVLPPLAHPAGAHVRRRILLGEGNQTLSRLPGGGQHPFGVVAVQVDAVDRPLSEDAQLRGEIVLKVGVLDGGDVVIADVEEAGGGEVGAQRAVVFQGLAGHLHGQVLQPGLDRMAEVALEVQGVGGGDVGLEPLHPVVGVDGGDDAALRPTRLRHISVQDGFQIVGGGGFALGTRQADDLQLPRGVVKEQVGQGGDGAAHVAHLETGQRNLRVGGLAHIGGGSPVPGHCQELRLEVGSLTEEQGAGDHLPGVVGHQLYRGGPVQLLRDRSGQQTPLLQQSDIVVEGVLCHRPFLPVLFNKNITQRLAAGLHRPLGQHRHGVGVKVGQVVLVGKDGQLGAGQHPAVAALSQKVLVDGGELLGVAVPACLDVVVDQRHHQLLRRPGGGRRLNPGGKKFLLV